MISEIDLIANLFIVREIIHSKKSVLKKGDLKVNCFVPQTLGTEGRFPAPACKIDYCICQ